MPGCGTQRELGVEDHRISIAGVLPVNQGARIHRTFVGDETVLANHPVIPDIVVIEDKNLLQGLRRVPRLGNAF